MSDPTSTVVLVHGAFAESSSWNPVIERLVHHPRLVGVSGHGPCDVVAVANPLRSLAGDAAYVRDVVGSISGPVVLVGHSYGGMVITEAAAELDSVTALVYVAAFAPETGESAFQLSTMFEGSSLAEALTAYPVATGGNEFAITRDRFRHQFAADVHQLEAELMAATQRPVTEAALSDGLVSAEPAWKRLPSWFVYGEQDLNIPADLHRFVAERAGSKGTVEIPGASHAISVSRPAEVAETIIGAVAATSPASVA
ncbi:alpha/beta fold hydrolase [Aquihabitans sp. McL0605]|uniref:alpha/beta fold hydrolase n=1 Tax=Aquihabitans sp. McL0605 TaxID=3415671 RepID=UPI003CEF9B97